MQPAPWKESIPQACAIPYRHRHGRIEFCLITTRKGNWIFPKGIVDPGETPPETARKEALEEAGLCGELLHRPVGRYEYRKWGRTLHVTAFLMRVERAESTWLEDDYRRRQWAPPEQALGLLSRPQLRDLLHTAWGRLAGRREPPSCG